MMILSEIDSASSGMMSLLLVFCAVVIMIVLLRRRQTGGESGRELAREKMAHLRDQRELRGSVDELLLQLEEVARRVSAEVETRFAKLESVIRDADIRIARLRNLAEDDKGAAGAPDSACAPSNATPAPARCRITQKTNVSERRAAAGSSTHAKPQLGDSSGDPRFNQVYRLVDAGAPPIKVAEQLGLPLGEVELILNLRRLG